jgi:WD40 repeat protein
MKNRIFKMLYILFVIGLISACSNTPQVTSIPTTIGLANTNVAQTPTRTIVPKESKTDESPTVTSSVAIKTSIPEITATEKIPEGISFDYQAIPLGKELLVTLNGRRVSILIKKVITGKDADYIALGKAPEEMQWVIIQLLIQYVQGEDNLRVQLLDPDQFDIVSKGHLEPCQPWLTYTPSPRLYDFKLLPGEESLGYLAFQAYREDTTPLLRFESEQNESFFSLTNTPISKTDPENDIQLIKESGFGAENQPVPFGTAVYIEQPGTVYKVYVKKVLRGFDAWKKISDGWGINKEPPEGMEYIMPYVSVQVARTSSKISVFNSDLFVSFSKQTKIVQPINFFCPVPCFQPATLYPNGNVSGWIPLLTYIDDPSPLMLYDDHLYFNLVDNTNTITNYQRTISPNAIGFANRNQIHKVQEFQQSGPVYVVAFTLDDRYLVSGGDDKIIHVWDVGKGSEIVSLKGHKGSIKDISFSLDGKKMASISGSEIIIWDTTSWQSLMILPIEGIGLGIKFLPDNSLLTITVAGETRIWDITSGKPGIQEPIPRYMGYNCGGSSVYSFDTNDDGSVLAVSLSCGSSVIWKRGKREVLVGDYNRYKDTKSGKPPLASAITLSQDGKRAAYGSVYYPLRRLMLMDVIDVDNKKVIGSVSPMDPDLFAVKVAPKDDLIVAGVANSIYAWWPEANICCEDNLIQLTGHNGRVTALEFSNNGEILASGDYTGKIILWNGK